MGKVDQGRRPGIAVCRTSCHVRVVFDLDALGRGIGRACIESIHLVLGLDLGRMGVRRLCDGLRVGAGRERRLGWVGGFLAAVWVGLECGHSLCPLDVRACVGVDRGAIDGRDGGHRHGVCCA